MIQHYTRFDQPKNVHLFKSMHADRKRVFIDTLNWDIPHDGIHEVDNYDTPDADYLILHDKETGAHLASVRLLRTTGPHILGDVFPELSEGPVPRGPTIREITRLVVSPDVPVRERISIRNMLGRAMIEFGLMEGITKYTAVCDFGFLTQLLASGWSMRPLGLPQMIHGSLIGALQIRCDRRTLDLTNEAWRFDAPALRIIERSETLVA